MKKLVYDLINKLNLPGIDFADVRLTVTDYQSIYFEKGILKNINSTHDNPALGIRILANGAWGFAGTSKLDDTALENLLKKAYNNAVTNGKFRKEKVKWSTIAPTVGSYFFTPEEDPFLMNDEEKISYFGHIAEKLTGHDKIVFSYIWAGFQRQYKIYANTEGTFTDTLVYDTDSSMQVLASDGQKVYSRTWPGDMSARRGGFEKVRQLQYEENVDRIVKEANDLLTAPTIEEEKADIIIGGSHLALQLHESVGHATEADRIFGMEISYAGKTFIKPTMLGNFRYGSDIVNIYSDSLNKNGMGYHLVDDEGVPCKKVNIVKNGILVNQQTSREIAPLLGLEASSNMMASYGHDIPLIRMTNFCLTPQKGSLKQLIENTDKGYLVDFTKTWSIDDNRNNFQFTTEIGWKIKDGKIVSIVKEPTYYGITPEFWGACDAICGPEEWQLYGTFNCGKGEPGQSMHLSHGVAPARFKNIVCNVKA